MAKKEIKDISKFGYLLYYIEFKLCKNIKRFIGRNEKFIEVLFLVIFFILQGFLAYYSFNIIVTFIVIVFLFFLALERIFIHIWLDYDREVLKGIEKTSKEKYDELRFNAYEEMSFLNSQLVILENKLRLLKKQR